MSAMSDRFVFWSPRILGLLVSMVIGIFALDAFSAGKPMLEALRDFLIHLIPATVVAALVIVSWRREWVSGLAFIGLGAFYAVVVGRGHPDWVLAISGPLLIIGALFLWSWQHRSLLRTS
jgi:hypothetical protein